MFHKVCPIFPIASWISVTIYTIRCLFIYFICSYFWYIDYKYSWWKDDHFRKKNINFFMLLLFKVRNVISYKFRHILIFINLRNGPQFQDKLEIHWHFFFLSVLKRLVQPIIVCLYFYKWLIFKGLSQKMFIHLLGWKLHHLGLLSAQ